MNLFRKRATSSALLTKTFRIMKISIALLIVVFNSAIASSYAQVAKFSINTKNTKISDILKQIEDQSEFTFFYYDNQVNVNEKVNVNVKNGSVEDILYQMFNQTNYSYEIVNKQILLTKKNLKEAVMQQNRKISGTVVDPKGEPIPGANVLVKGTTLGVITDIEGNFSIEVPANAILQISYIGFNTQEITISGKKTFHIVLAENSQALDEVVVIGYGVQKKSDLTGAVANISTDKLNTESNVNIMNALQGKLAGVDIVSQGGKPGAGSRIMIRGIGTLNNSTPLYIVDGMYFEGIDHINPNDIQSIDVLKDASASAIYGSRAANGVVIVTTKNGVDTQGVPQLDFSMNLGVQTPERYLSMLNAAQWAEVSTASRTAAGKPILDMANDLSTKEDNDWQRIIMGNALMQNYNASVKGGNKGYTYYVGLGYFNQDGVMKETNYERFNIQAKSDYKRGWFTFGHNILLQMSTTLGPNTSDAGNISYLATTLFAIPTQAKYDPTRVGGYGHLYGDVFNNPHPLVNADRNLRKNDAKSYSVNANIYAQMELPFGLKYKLTATPGFSFGDGMEYDGIYDTGLVRNAKTSLKRTTTKSNNILIENIFTYDKTFGDHKVSALLGYTYQEDNYRYTMASGMELPEGIYEITAATSNRNNDGTSSKSSLSSILSRVFYSYKNRYLFTATLRRDGSSRFGSNNRYGNFPSFSLGWNMAEESFMKKSEWLDQLKVRGGYGVLGNQEIGNYLYQSSVSSGMNYPNGKGGLDYGSFPKEFSSPSIRWEETAMTNIGLDMILLQNRLSFTGEYYIKNTKDILLTVPIPPSTGGSNDPVRNAGKISNKGFEFSVSWRDQVQNDFSYGASFVGNIMKNNVTEMGTGDQVIWAGSTGGTSNVNTSKTLQGYPIGGFWLIPTDGLFKNTEEVQAHSKDGKLIQPAAVPGDVRFKDVNNNGTIDDGDRVYLGSPFPSFTMGLNLNAQWKWFDIMVGIQGNFGNKIYNATKVYLENTTAGINYLSSTLDYWTEQNTNASYPRLTWNDTNRNLRPESDRYLEDGSYVRLRNIQVGYTLPRFIKGLNKCRVYVNMENLFTITGYSGYTPDVNNGAAMSRGVDNFIYPLNKTFMLGLNVSF